MSVSRQTVDITIRHADYENNLKSGENQTFLLLINSTINKVWQINDNVWHFDFMISKKYKMADKLPDSNWLSNNLSAIYKLNK